MRNIKNNTESKAARKGSAFLLIIILALSTFAAVLTGIQICAWCGRSIEEGELYQIYGGKCYHSGCQICRHVVM